MTVCCVESAVKNVTVFDSCLVDHEQQRGVLAGGGWRIGEGAREHSSAFRTCTCSIELALTWLLSTSKAGGRLQQDDRSFTARSRAITEATISRGGEISK